MATQHEIREVEGRKKVRRFNVSARIEHIILLVTFTGLAVTGLPQKYTPQPWAESMIAIMGGIETVRIIHRVLATALMASGIYHFGMITYKLFVLGEPPYMLPSFKDLTDLIDVMKYNLGFSDEHPKMERFNFEEKMEYWAVIWGMGVMIATGFMLWNPIATARFLPGEAIPAALRAHGQEALLAVLAIITWHFYNVLTHGNLSIFTGWIRKDIMEHKHTLEMERIEKGEDFTPPPAEVIRKRLRWFIPLAIVMTVALTAALIWFVTFEQTAITTIPPTQ